MAAAFPDSVAAFEGRVETGDGVEVAHGLKMRLRRAKRERVVLTKLSLDMAYKLLIIGNGGHWRPPIAHPTLNPRAIRRGTVGE